MDSIQSSGPILSSIRVLGRTGPAELQDRVWQSLDKPARQQASVLNIEQKLVMQPTFRRPMLVRVPHPAWAMKYEHIAANAQGKPRNV